MFHSHSYHDLPQPNPILVQGDIRRDSNYTNVVPIIVMQLAYYPILTRNLSGTLLSSLFYYAYDVVE